MMQAISEKRIDEDSCQVRESNYRIFFFFFSNTIFVSSHMNPENPEGTQVIVGSMNMEYISNTLYALQLLLI